jgi:transposase
MRFSSLLDRQERGEITQEEAAEMLGVHVRTFQRWAARYEDEGEAGLADRRVAGDRRGGRRRKSWSGCSGFTATSTRPSR